MSDLYTVEVHQDVVGITFTVAQGPPGPISGGSTGDVAGPAGSTADGQLALFDDGTGKLIRGAVSGDAPALRTFLSVYSIAEVDAIGDVLEAADADIIADLLVETAAREDADDVLQDQITALGAVATESVAGLMSATDKIKINDLFVEAQVPVGGTTGQVLAKVSATDYDLAWVDQTGGGGGGGDITGASNLGDGDGVWADEAAGLLRFKSLENGDLITLTADSTEILIAVTKASQAEAQAGTIDTKAMTPLRVAEALAALGPAQEFAVPAGGTTGQALIKSSSTDYDFAWTDIEVGGGTGDVVGPAGSTADGDIALFDDTTGKLIRKAVSGDAANLRTFLSVYSTSQVDSLLAALTSGLDYKGAWNATTNSPTLASGTGTQGDYYVVGTAGTTTIDGINDWAIGDWIVYNGTVWQKIDNTDKVSSVAGLTGPILADDLITALALEIADINNLQTILDGKASTDLADATDPGLMSSAHYTKLEGIAAGANLYVHPSGDGNRHVPTTDAGDVLKFLKSGSSEGAAPDWSAIAIADVTSLQDALDGKVDDGQGLPTGGTTGQMLVKNSATNYDVIWADPPEGGGGGDISGASNLGTTTTRQGVFEGELTGVLRFKSLVPDTGIEFTADSAEIAIAVIFADTTEAEAGTAADVVMSPARTAEAITELGAGEAWAVPAGGTTGQFLRKASATDYDFAWETVAVGEVNTMSNLGATAGRQGFYAQKTSLNFDMKSLVATGLAALSATSTEVTVDVPLASQLEAEAGTNNTKAMSPLRVAEAIAALAGSGGGDMLKSVYDPTNIEASAFDVDNHIDGTVNHVFTAADDTKLAGIEALADVTDAVNVAAAIVSVAAKGTPVDADTIPLIDSEAGSAMKELSWAAVKSNLVTYLNSASVLTAFLTASSGPTALTNKTIDANGTGNDITNLDVANFAANVIDIDDLLTANSDTRIPSQQAVKAYVDTGDADLAVDILAEQTAREDADDALQLQIDTLQPGDAVLDALSALTIGAADLMIYSTGANTFGTTTITTQGRQLLDDTSFSAMLTTLGAQATDVVLDYLSTLTPATDRLPYFDSGTTMALATFTTQARQLLDDTSFSAMLTTLGAAPSARSLTAAGLVTGGGDLSADRTFTVAEATQPEAEAGTLGTVAITPRRLVQGVLAMAPTDANFWSSAASKVVTVASLWSAAVPVSTAFSATKTISLNDGLHFIYGQLTAASTLTLGDLTGKAGRSGWIVITVDGTNRAITFQTGSRTAGGFTTLAKTFTASTRNVAHYTIEDAATPIIKWTFELDVKA